MLESLRSLSFSDWLILGAAIGILVSLNHLSKQLAAIFDLVYDIRERVFLSLPRHPLEDVDDPDAKHILNELRQGKR